LTSGNDDDLVGKVLDGRYKILESIGSGTMGVVYLATHQLMGRTVAVKMLKAEMVAGSESLERFHQEAKAVGALSHPNLIAVFDSGITEAGEPYLVMEYLKGGSLDDLIEKEGRLPAARVAEIFSQVCDGLYHAHQKGIIHRDLKPSNIMLAELEGGGETVKIVDFGIARLLPIEGKDLETLTRTGTFFGSPTYLSPEQCIGRAADARSDLYAVGCAMFESLTGKLPFESELPIEVVTLKLAGTAIKLSETSPDLKIPPQLERVVMKAMDKDPDKRYQSMDLLKRDLEPFILRSAHSATAGLSGPAARAAKWSGRKLFSLLVIPLLVICAIALFLLGTDSGKIALKETVLRLQELRVGPNDPSLLTTLTQLADLYISQKRPAEAYQVCERILYISRKARRTNYLQFADLCDRMGSAFQISGHGGESSKCYKLEVVVLNEGRNEFIKRKDPAGAEAYAVRAVAVVDAHFGNDMPLETHILRQLVDVYKGEGNWHQAAAIYIRLPEGNFNKDDLDLIYKPLWALCDDNGCRRNPKLAETSLKQFIALNERVNGPNNPSSVGGLRMLGYLYQKMGDLARAKQALLLAIERGQKPPPEFGVAASALQLSDVCFISHDFAQAKKYALLYFDLDKKVPDPGHSQTSGFKILGDIAKLEKDNEQALVYYKQALEADLSRPKLIVESLAGSYQDYAFALIKAGNKTEAQRLLDLREKLFERNK